MLGDLRQGLGGLCSGTLTITPLEALSLAPLLTALLFFLSLSLPHPFLNLAGL